MTTHDGGPAFPALKEPWTDMGGSDITSGMSLRDWFAGQALDYSWRYAFARAGQNDPIDNIASLAASWSYAAADAMLAERAKAKP